MIYRKIIEDLWPEKDENEDARYDDKIITDQQ